MAEVQDSLDVIDFKEKFLECPVCLEHFDQAERRPRLLVNCLHSFCSQCLEQLLKKEGRGQVTCPNCRQVQKVQGNAQSLPIDPVRNKLVDYVRFKKGKQIPCTDCPDGSHAVARCHECQSYMCTPCKEAHHRNRMTRKHTCQSLKEALSEPVKNFMSHHCKDHPDYKVEFYCGQCSSLCCVSCPIVKHKGHDLDPIEDAANSMLSSLKTKMEDVEKSAALLRRKKTSLDQESTRQNNNLKLTTDSILKKFDELICKLYCQRKKLITQLRKKTESTVYGLKKKCTATENSLAQVESTLEYFKQMENKSDDCEVLSAGPVLVKSLEAAAAVDLTEDVQDPTWTFSPEEMDSVISKVHRFGKIHCDTKKMSAECKLKIPKELKHEKEFQERTGFTRGSFTSNIQILATPKYPEVFYHAPSDKKSIELPQSKTLTPPLNETGKQKEYKTEKLNPIQYAAAKHLVGDQELEKACRIRDKTDGQIMVTFFDTSSAQKIHGKILGFNFVIVEIPTTKDVSLFLENVMDDMKNVYAELDQGKKQVHIVSEEWIDLDAARRRIQHKFTHNKPTSRSNRTFIQKQEQSQPPDPSHSDSPQYSTDSNPSIPDVVEGTPVFKIGFLTVKVYKADMTKLKIDAIVNAANENLSHGSGVARAIADAAGSALEKEENAYVHKHGPIPVGKVVATTSGNMKCKMVLHAVGPRWSDYTDKKKCLEDLCKTILRCLIETSNCGLTSVAIPAISSGIFRVPKESCCENYVKGTKLFVEIVHHKVSLQEVHFVDVSDKMVSMMTEAFEVFGQSPLTFEEKNLSLVKKELKAEPSSQQPSVTTEKKKAHGSGPAAIGLKTKQTLEGTRYSYKVGKYSTLKLYSEDLVKTKAELLVSWQDINNKPVNRASKELRNETGKIPAYHGGSKFLDVKSTDAGNLKSVKKIVHACCPTDTMTTADLQTIIGRIIDIGCILGRSLAITEVHSSSVDLTSFCDVLCKVLQVKRDEVDKAFDVHLVDKDPAKVAEMKVIVDKQFSPETSETVEGAVGGNLEENCVICHDLISDPKTLSCSHKFCRSCIDQSFKYKPVCPSCGKIFGAVMGDMPPGTMKVRKMSSSLPGFSYASKTYMITYRIPSGRQTANHPNPGEWYKGATWFAYLPETQEGEIALRLLKVAFDRHLTFTVGWSRTAGNEYAVIWNGIHHKTSTASDGTFGYPDKGYFERVKGELAAKGVTEADIDWNKSLKSIFGL